MDKEELIALADEKGVEIDKRWSAERIQAALDPAPEVKRIPVLVIRDVWEDEYTRHRKGSTPDVPLEMGKKWLKEGKVERNDPLPGDD